MNDKCPLRKFYIKSGKNISYFHKAYVDYIITDKTLYGKKLYLNVNVSGYAESFR